MKTVMGPQIGRDDDVEEEEEEEDNDERKEVSEVDSETNLICFYL